MNILRTVALALAAAAALLSGTAFAQSTQSATSTFNVELTLTPKCYINMAGNTAADVATGDVTLTYDSFQETHAEQATGFTVRCTNSLSYGVAVSAESASIAGINYYLQLGAGPASSATYTSAVGGGTLSPSATGNGSAQNYYIGVRAPRYQAGTCNGASCNGSNVHTITVSY